MTTEARGERNIAADISVVLGAVALVAMFFVVTTAPSIREIQESGAAEGFALGSAQLIVQWGTYFTIAMDVGALGAAIVSTRRARPGRVRQLIMWVLAVVPAVVSVVVLVTGGL